MLVLGIDAAWTPAGSSGIALLARNAGAYRIVATDDSYAAFCRRANVAAPPPGDGAREGAAVLQAAQILGDALVDVVAIDMPISRRPILERRVADNTISQLFGHCGTAVHSPKPTCPGPYGQAFAQAFQESGFTLATRTLGSPVLPALIEVYPHVALIGFLNRSYRVPYKVGKTYIKGAPRLQRIAALLEEWRAICAFCENEGLTMPELPDASDLPTNRTLKRIEDTIDAVICVLVGVRYLQNRLHAIGDHDAAIWVPIEALALGRSSPARFS